MIGLPDGGLKPLAAGVADGDVWEEVVVVVRDERIGEEDPEWMVGNRGKDVVAEGTAPTISGPRWVVKERCEISQAAL